ncbi:TPA: hypothetical protein N0F65_000120 [Lagenidium giganteum]|uniref:Uncharacterized protein n=1 Tax=Lagenidium giganteum TaxID=4803 RepID=A0AAV2YYQ0_9STRA|nr:TPA: hypothetical protein N0F65_000120 [Lagenidium giganteum]
MEQSLSTVGASPRPLALDVSSPLTKTMGGGGGMSWRPASDFYCNERRSTSAPHTHCQPTKLCGQIHPAHVRMSNTCTYAPACKERARQDVAQSREPKPACK